MVASAKRNHTTRGWAHGKAEPPQLADNGSVYGIHIGHAVIGNRDRHALGNHHTVCAYTCLYISLFMLPLTIVILPGVRDGKNEPSDPSRPWMRPLDGSRRRREPSDPFTSEAPLGAVELVDIEEFPTNYTEKHPIIVISLSILSRTDSVLFQCNVSVSNGSTNTTVSKKKSDAYQSV